MVEMDGQRWMQVQAFAWFGEHYLAPLSIRLKAGVQLLPVIRPDWTRVYNHDEYGLSPEPVCLVQWPDEGSYALVRLADGSRQQCPMMDLPILLTAPLPSAGRQAALEQIELLAE